MEDKEIIQPGKVKRKTTVHRRNYEQDPHSIPNTNFLPFEDNDDVYQDPQDQHMHQEFNPRTGSEQISARPHRSQILLSSQNSSEKKQQEFVVTTSATKKEEIEAERQQMFDRMLRVNDPNTFKFYQQRKRDNNRNNKQKLEEEKQLARMSQNINRDYMDDIFSRDSMSNQRAIQQDIHNMDLDSLNPSFISDIKNFTLPEPRNNNVADQIQQQSISQQSLDELQEIPKSKFASNKVEELKKRLESSFDEEEEDQDEEEFADEVNELENPLDPNSPKDNNEYLANILDQEFDDAKQTGSPASGRNQPERGTTGGLSSEEDIIRLVDKNERRHEGIAVQQLEKDQIISLKSTKSDESHRKILSLPEEMTKISQMIHREHGYNGSTVTCIATSDDLLLYGTSEGVLRMFDREGQEEYDSLAINKKEFQGNAITCIDVHPLKTEYLVLGFMKGQLVLYDVTDPKKPLKTISDHHKGTQVVNVKFCDWRGKFQNEQMDESYDGSLNKSQFQGDRKDKQKWMFISIDESGKVVLTTVSKIVIVLKSSKQVLYNPKQGGGAKYTSVACRFFSQVYPQGEINDNSCILALGNSQEVIVITVTLGDYQIKMRASKPRSYYDKKQDKFVDIKPFAPILNWGYGHSPIFKDRAYSILAIGWGPLIQLIVLNTLEDEKNAFLYDGFYLLKPELPLQQQNILTELKEELKNEMECEEEDEGFNEDFGQSFTNSSLYIEDINFLSNSTLMVLTKGNTIRILNTEQFRPEEFYADMHRRVKDYKEGNKGLDAEYRVAELGEEQKIDPIKPSMFGIKFLQTFKYFKGIGFILNEYSISRFYHMSWSQSLRDYKKEVDGNWINVFNRALSFYKGNLKGYRGLYDDEEMRESVMKAELKLLITEFIQEEIEKQAQLNQEFEQSSNKIITNLEEEMKNSQEDVKENILKLAACRQEREENYKTLLRIVIEFCVELEDSHFLFYDLCLFFRDEQLEDLFIDQLEPFIVAGKFSRWEIANENLQNHLINYYKQSAKPENLEKIIINLNFSDFDKNVVLELVHYCEQHYLSTAVLYLYTQVIESEDDIHCSKVLWSICEIYQKANFTGTIDDIENMQYLSPRAKQRVDIEKSQIYIGFKLLWVIKLFIHGKKFPKGEMKDQKWRKYVIHVVRFISDVQNLKMLISIDAETFFQIISSLFYSGNASQFIQEESKQNTKISHRSLIDLLRDVCKQIDNEEIHLSHVFFEANIAVNSEIEQDPSFYYQVVKDLLQEHQKYLLFNEHSLKRTMSRSKILKQLSRTLVKKIPDEVKHFIKSENDLINLVKKSEPLDNDQVDELIIMSKSTSFMLLRVFLLEKKGFYVSCLQLLLEGIRDNDERYKKYLQEIAFNWIREKLLLLEEKSKENESSKKLYNQFKKELMDNIKYMVLFNVQESICLIDQQFGAIHTEVINQLRMYPNEQLLYVENFLRIKDDHIQKTIKEFIISQANAVEAKKYLELLKLNLKLCCQYKKESVLQVVEKICLQSYDPTEECLAICMEYKQTEACALLNKKLGKYFDSVAMYLDVIDEKVDFKQLKRELKRAAKSNFDTTYPQKTKTLPNSTLFDHYLKKVLKICQKNHDDVDIGKEEQIWFIIVDMLFDQKNKAECRSNHHYQVFFKVRIQHLTKLLLNYMPFKSFLTHVLNVNKTIKYREMIEIIKEIFNDCKFYTIIINNSNEAIRRTNTMLFQKYQEGSSEGLLFRSLICMHCKGKLNIYDNEENRRMSLEIKDFDNLHEEPLDLFYEALNDEIRIFDCLHTYHITCLQKICYLKIDEPEEIRQEKMKKLRCPKCYSQNLDIDDGQGSPTRQRTRMIHKGSSQKIDNMEFKEEMMVKKEEKRKETVRNNELFKFQKKMQYFESGLDSEFLSLSNFK